MGIGSIGSVPSFWQQDQSYSSGQKSEAAAQSASNALINAMSSAMVTKAKGLASIANSTALKRVNTELTSEIQQILTGSLSSGSTGASSAAGTSTKAAPAVATGHAPVTTGTLLSTLGIPAGGSVIISAGGNTTTYASTGSDTIGDLISAINEDYVGNAAVTASLNKNGDLVITGKNTTDTITIGGVYASNIGFAVGNQTFKPTKGSGPLTTSASASTSASSTTSSKSSSGTSSRGKTAVSTLAQETASSAASLLSASGAAGSVVNLLA
jgi:hypothetical protein